MLKPYEVTFRGTITVNVNAHNEEEAIDKAECIVEDRNSDFDYTNFSPEVKIGDE